ncbi:MAG TPA: hypothetical protein VGE93_15455, partial [Bryobacteraceae bacterium]
MGGLHTIRQAPSAAQIEGHKRVTLTIDQLNRLADKQALSANAVSTVENGRLFTWENDSPNQAYLAEQSVTRPLDQIYTGKSALRRLTSVWHVIQVQPCRCARTIMDRAIEPGRRT